MATTAPAKPASAKRASIKPNGAKPAEAKPAAAKKAAAPVAPKPAPIVEAVVEPLAIVTAQGAVLPVPPPKPPSYRTYPEKPILAVGDKAPDFAARDDAGNAISLRSYKGQKIILYFYPKDDTSGCTKEACEFQANMRSIKTKGAVVIGVSPDSEKSHQKFKAKFELGFPLIVDEDKIVIKLYGVWKEKSMYGKTFMGVERSTFIVGVDGKIAKIFRNVKVTDHVAQVVEALRDL